MGNFVCLLMGVDPILKNVSINIFITGKSNIKF